MSTDVDPGAPSEAPDERTAAPSRALARAHERARRDGLSPRLYALARLVLTPLLGSWFRFHPSGAEHLPEQGPVIVAPNHKSFIDAFFVGIATRRHVRFMAKAELFRGLLGRLLVRLGAFPVKRGESDCDAVRTARTLLEQGHVVVLFPEGTRVDEPDALGSPHHGAGRLSLETGAPIVPTAIAGTSKLWFGPLPKPRRVRLTFLEPVLPGDGPLTPQAMAEVIDDAVWPAVRDEYGRLVATPGPVVSALAAAGIAGGLVARRRRRHPPPRLLGFVESRRARRAKKRGNVLHRLRRSR